MNYHLSSELPDGFDNYTPAMPKRYVAFHGLFRKRIERILEPKAKRPNDGDTLEDFERAHLDETRRKLSNYWFERRY
jgi:hypothetical protein